MAAPFMTKLFRLNNGNPIPSVGLGTSRIKVYEMSDIITTAVENGYRHFDSAQNYKNTVELGEALQKVLKSGKVKRKDLFITTKERILAVYSNRPEDVKSSFDECLLNLQLDSVDLFLIHHPAGFKKASKQYIQHGFKDEHGIQQWFEIADHLKIWREMEKLVDAGLTKSIGVSNFNKEQLSFIVSNSRIKPAVLQTECHAYLQELELLQYCLENQILLTAFAPLGSPGLEYAGFYSGFIYREVLQFQSSNVGRLKENINIFDFELLPEDITALSELDCGHRIFSGINFVRNHPQSPYLIQSDGSRNANSSS